MKKIIPVLGATLVAVLMLAMGCATVPHVADPSGVAISVSQMPIERIRSYYGTNAANDLNPFIPSGGIISRQTADYIVLQVKIEAVRKADITLYRGIATNSAGDQVAELYRSDQFLKYLKDWSIDPRAYQQVRNRAERAYFPGFDVKVGPGTHRYVVVLLGKHPMPLPAHAVVTFAVDNGAPRAVGIDVTKID